MKKWTTFERRNQIGDIIRKYAKEMSLWYGWSKPQQYELAVLHPEQDACKAEKALQELEKVLTADPRLADIAYKSVCITVGVKLEIWFSE